MDPYKILEVSPNATPEEIHASYLRLVKKYHPDRYPDGPQKDFATEKIKQINAAYDMLSDKKGASSASSYSGTNAGSGAPSDAAVFSRVRDLIRSGQLTAAAHLLDAMNTRSAQWYYLRGVIYQKSGYYDHAKQCYASAVSSEPMNPEYRRAYESLVQSGAPYASAPVENADGCDFCTLCSICMCMNMCSRGCR